MAMQEPKKSQQQKPREAQQERESKPSNPAESREGMPGYGQPPEDVRERQLPDQKW